MSLIIMAVYDTDANGRSEYTAKTLQSLTKTVDWGKHRLIVVDNGSCEATKKILEDYKEWNGFHYFPTIITLSENVGTARAINEGLKLREPGEMCIKIDNDVVIHSSGWVEEMEEVIARDTTIGIVGLKRKDVDFDARHGAVQIALPHIAGQRWITVEGGGQIMGTCTMFNWRLIDKIGYSFQPNNYGFEDTLYDLRSRLAGFWNCYLPHIEILHIDTGENPYTQEKHEIARQSWAEYKRYHDGYIDGTIPIYYNGGFKS